jgi:uncharacterized repeat protein (TIGR01451 family)
MVANDEEAEFLTASEAVASQLPPPYTAQRIYKSAYATPPDVTPALLAALDQGAFLVNFIGHGSPTAWYWQGTEEDIFATKDLGLLQNGPRYPFLITGNCANGRFALPEKPDTLAETFVRLADKGGIAAWSPTGLGYTVWHESLIADLYQAIFAQGIHQLGTATTAAKVATFAQLGWAEPVETFVLFGDPALALPVVQPRLLLESQVLSATALPGQPLTYRLTATNAGTYAAENVTLTVAHDPQTPYLAATPPPTDGDHTWQLGTLAAGATQTVTVTVQVADTVAEGMMLHQQATLAGDGLAPQTADANTYVGTLPFAFSMRALTPTVQPGELLTYTLAYTNTSEQPLEQLVLTTTYAAHTVYHRASSPPTQGDHVWQLAPLAPGTADQIILTLRVLATTPAGTQLRTQAALHGAGLGSVTRTTATIVTALAQERPPLALGIRATPATVQPGQLLTYTLAYTNTSEQPLEQLVLTTTYAAHTAYQRAEPPPTQDDHVWYLAALPAGAAGAITVVVRILAMPPEDGLLLTQAVLRQAGGSPVLALTTTQVAPAQTYLPIIEQAE